MQTQFDKNFWDSQYTANNIGWDLGVVSPPIKNYFDTIKNKNISILIPGCGNTHEATYLLESGFTNITVIDIAPTLVEKLEQKFKGNKNITIILGDFFEHNGTYDYIIEQTFFCALHPSFRIQYAEKIYQLLNINGILVGLLFNITFEKNPPFGGNQIEYEKLFEQNFCVLKIEKCNNSIKPRMNTELFIEIKK